MKNQSKIPAKKTLIAAVLLMFMMINIAIAYNPFASVKVVDHLAETYYDISENVSSRINGFSLDEIGGTVKAITENPEIAKFEFRVKNKWIKGGHNRSRIQGFYGGGQEDSSRKKPFIYDNSEPPILLGNNEGANPVEYILHGLAGCMTTTMVLHAAANGIQLKSVESSLEGDLDVMGFLGLNDKVRNGYQQIRVKFNIEGDLTQEQKEKLESFVRKSPVFDIVTNEVPVLVSLEY
ncbi:MAG TPA: OsmC family protein [Anditalea sp.]|nr:OsmC family protein [Anditalea sp.]